MAKRTEDLQKEDCMWALYDTKTQTFLRKSSWLGFAIGPLKVYASEKKAKQEGLPLAATEGWGDGRVAVVKLNISEVTKL